MVIPSFRPLSKAPELQDTGPAAPGYATYELPSPLNVYLMKSRTRCGPAERDPLDPFPEARRSSSPASDGWSFIIIIKNYILCRLDVIACPYYESKR